MTPDCYGWGPASGVTGVSLLNGTEFQGAISDYNGIMAPTLTLVDQAKTSHASNLNRNFMQYASAKGWIMAGSYFFDLIQLNMAAQQSGGTTDKNTGLEQSSFSLDNLSSAFGSSQGGGDCGGKYALVCVLFGGDPSAVNDVINLIDGSTSSIGPIPIPDLAPLKTRRVIDGPGSSTVYGYANNASILQLQGQPGNKTLMFDKLVYVPAQVKPQPIPDAHFSCGRVGLLGCVGRALGNLFMNKIFLGIYNLFISIFAAIISDVVMSFIVAPLSGMAEIFNQGVAIISKPGVNPIIALANMGTYYINFAGEMWLQMLFLAITSSILPYVGPFIFALISMAMPIMVTWLSLMVSVGFVTAYYIPIMPYMVFVFGGIAWLMAVIEAMVAAPIIALGVTQPEGHESFGKAEPAIMILMNIFLRPSMMIVGFIAAISLSYVSVWVINAGFTHAISFVQASSETEDNAPTLSNNIVDILNKKPPKKTDDKMAKNYQMNDVGVQGGYTGWAGVFAYFFSILAYTTMYLTVVQKSFTLISILPDKILRWIGGQPESYGSESGQWGEEAKGKIEKAGDASNQAQAQTGKQMQGGVTKAMSSLPGAGSGGDVTASGSQGGGDGGGGDGSGGDGGGKGGGGKGGGGGGQDLAKAATESGIPPV